MGSLSPPSLFSEKFYIENYSKISGFVISTLYYVLNAVSVEDIAMIVFYHDNTAHLGDNFTINVTIDGELFTLTDDIGDQERWYLCLEHQTVGTNAVLSGIVNEPQAFGIRSDEISGTGEYYKDRKRWGGHSVTIAYQVNGAPQAGQRVDIDVYYRRKEAI